MDTFVSTLYIEPPKMIWKTMHRMMRHQITIVLPFYVAADRAQKMQMESEKRKFSPFI